MGPLCLGREIPDVLIWSRHPRASGAARSILPAPRHLHHALVLVLGIRGSAGVVAQEATPTTGGDLANLVLPPDAPAYGLTYEAWTARFAQWRHSLPMTIDPGTDRTGERYGYGQAGPVFFQVQSGEEAAERTCTVPAGTALLLPLLEATCTTVEPPPFFGRDEAELRACTEALFATPVELTMVIDGVSIPDLERYRVQSEPFTVVLPEDNILELEPTVLEGVIEGYWLLLAPLPPRAHELRFGGGLPEFGFSTEVTNHLTVAEPMVVEPTDTMLDATPTA